MDKAKKKQVKKIITWVLLAALVAVLAAMPLLAKAEAEADGPVASIHSGTVETGNIRTTLHGGGTLTTEDIEDINLPSGVKITEFLVKNGDTVTAGTPLAAVDKVSVMTAITSVTETMEYLQEEMKSSKDEQVDSTITATAGGRIKKVYARKGDSVQEVMLRDGALALLSLDGLMAVEIEKKVDLLTGDTVTVTLADKTKVTGRIASNLDGVIVITLEDKGYDIGETVTVTAKDGSEVGTGELYVHNAWIATAYSGIIQTAPAKEETKVTSGATLFTLTETDFRGKLAYLSSLHREYEELMQDLFTMYRSGTIDAPCDGMISGIDKDSPHLLAAENEGPVEASLLTTEQGSWKVVLLSGEVHYDLPEGSSCNPMAGEECPETNLVMHGVDCPKFCHNSADCDGIGTHHPGCIKSCTSGASCKANFHTVVCIESCQLSEGKIDCGRDANYFHKPGCIKSCKQGDKESDCEKATTFPHYPSCIKSCVPSDGTKDCPATKHFPGCIEKCSHATEKDPDACKATPHHYPDCIQGCIKSDSASKACPSSIHHKSCFFYKLDYKAKVALVTQVGSSELVVSWDASNQEYTVEKVGSGWKFSNEQGFNMDLLVKKGTISVSNPKSYKPGDVIFVVTGYRGKEAVWTGIPVYIRGAGKINGNLDLDLDLDGLKDSITAMLMPQIDLSSLLAGFGNFGFYAPSPVEEDKLFDLEGSTLMTVSPQETVSLTISLDEQDIAKVAVGQKATVKVEALSGEIFEAEITEVANRGSNNGGSSKFTAKLELDKTKDMLDGMSATASLPLEEKQNIPTIPVIALEEQGAQTVVYTALDKEGQPTNPVPVTIGISDGLTAEILSGLDVGDTYYYRYYDVLEEDTGVEERFTLT